MPKKDKGEDRSGREPEPATTAVPPGYDPETYLHTGTGGEGESKKK